MITIRLSGASLDQLKTIHNSLKQRLGVNLCDTDVVRYSVRWMAKHLDTIPETTFEAKRCADCNVALALVTVDGVDQLQCPQCGEVKS